MRIARAYVESDVEKIGGKDEVSIPMALRVAKLSAFVRTKKQSNALQPTIKPVINELIVNLGGTLINVIRWIQMVSSNMSS